jgi:hypothetical protein
MKKLKFQFLLKFISLSLLVPQMALAALSFVGPLDPANGFPRWYKDSNGLRLTLCLDQNTFCLPLEDVDPDQAVSFPDNFPGEAFWWTADAAADVGDGEVQLVLALEAAFAGEAPVEGERISFARVRIRARGIPLGTYRITHPYGQEIFEATGTTGRQINMTDDVGIEIERFNGALSGAIGPFLVWDPSVAPFAPVGFVGDPNVEHAVIGSPFGTNFLRVERLVNGVYTTVGFSNLFSVQGKLDTLPEEPIVSITPKGGLFSAAPIVTIRSSIPANIFYTLDGSNPLTSLTRIRYTGPFQLPNCAAIKYSAQTSNARSDVGTELYVKAP